MLLTEKDNYFCCVFLLPVEFSIYKIVGSIVVVAAFPSVNTVIAIAPEKSLFVVL